MGRVSEDKATADFETRSACNIKKTGAWKYSLDPTTEVLCLVYRLPHWRAGATALYHPRLPGAGLPEHIEDDTLEELFEWIDAGLALEAHNAFFERAIWTNILAPRHGFPLVGEDQWRCSQAKAAAHALPRKLADATKALGLAEQKDTEKTETEGVRVLKQIHIVRKVSKPRKPRKKEREEWARLHGDVPMPLLWWEDSSLFERLFAYCRQDVLAEEALSHALEDLSAEETAYYCLDQRMNQRGFQLDMEAVETALRLIATEATLLNAELATVTDGFVTRATQRDRMKEWLASEDVTLYDTKGATIDALLGGDDEAGDADGPDDLPGGMETLPPRVRRALEIMRTLTRSSTAKFDTMRQWACPDGRVRGGLLYHGATTGRWSGAGVQPHNFPKGTIKGFDMEAAWDLLKTQDRERIMAHHWGKT